jgi:rhodanese-related sulfurtransferase
MLSNIFCVSDREKPLSVFIFRRRSLLRNMVLILFALFVQAFPAYHGISADTLSNWITNGPPFSFILIDVRDTSEVDTIMGTTACRPYHLSFNQGVFAANYSLLPKTSNVILYCKSGGRSGQAAAFLDAAGYASVYALSGGFSSWKGPKQVRANFLPLSDLPKNSMIAGSAVVFSTTAGFRKTETSAGVFRHFTGNRCIFSRIKQEDGFTQYFDAKGKRLIPARHKGLP